MHFVKIALLTLGMISIEAGIQASAQTSPNSSDSLLIRQVFDEVLSHGEAHENLRVLCKDIGHRLSGSPSADRAMVWGQQRMDSYGVDTSYIMPVEVPAWTRGDVAEAQALSADGIAMDLHITALGGSVPTPDDGWIEGPLLVVMGGSQGALGLNRMVRVLLPELLSQGCRVVHLTGSNDPDVNSIEHNSLVERPFSDDIPGLLQHADLAISRAGAGSLSELAVSSTPSVLVPFPQAADQHQDANAACAAALGAAVIVHQHSPNHPALRDTLWRLLGPRLGRNEAAVNPLPAMQQAMQQLAVRDADRQLAALLDALVP